MPILKRLQQHKILLDTHVWLWSMTAHPTLIAQFRQSLELALSRNVVLVSPISVWEIGMLVEKKRIEIEMDVLEWIDRALETPGIQLAAITPSIAIQSTRLPNLAHCDPADRLLIATAHEESAVLVTCDKKILQYGQDKFLAVYDPS